MTIQGCKKQMLWKKTEKNVFSCSVIKYNVCLTADKFLETIEFVVMEEIEKYIVFYFV